MKKGSLEYLEYYNRAMVEAEAAFKDGFVSDWEREAIAELREEAVDAYWEVEAPTVELAIPLVAELQWRYTHGFSADFRVDPKTETTVNVPQGSYHEVPE